MEIRYATISKTGRRHNNEDAYKVIDMPQNNRFMGIVCDGMGGHSFGETASETVCNTISDFWKKHISTPDCDSKVKLACKKASCAIDQKAFELHHAEMGTTMVMVSIEVMDYFIRQKTISGLILDGRLLPSASSLTAQKWQYQTSDKSNYRLVTEFYFVRMDYTKAWLLKFCKQG